jgi:predicted TIM-barrel fold metal-dependent hydrolase
MSIPTSARASRNWSPTARRCGNRPNIKAHCTAVASSRTSIEGVGEAAPRPDHSGRDTVWMGAKVPRPGVQDDNPANRVADMDDEGTDVHFLVPGGWSSLICVDDVSLETGMIRAFHRHMADFCGQYPDRLKGPIVASTRDANSAVEEIRKWGKSKWAVAVKPQVYKTPVDHPSLDPIWRTAAEYALPIVHHSSTLLPGSRRHVGQHLPGTVGVAPVGRNAVCRGVVHRRRHFGPSSVTALRHARMRLRLATVLGQAHGRAVRLCRLDRRIEDEAK